MGSWFFTWLSDTDAVAVWSNTDDFDGTNFTSVCSVSVFMVSVLALGFRPMAEVNVSHMAEWWFVDLQTKHLLFFWHDLMECPGYKHLKHNRLFHTISFRFSNSVTMEHLSEKWFCLQNEHFN